jgi:hypothetical protein
MLNAAIDSTIYVAVADLDACRPYERLGLILSPAHDGRRTLHVGVFAVHFLAEAGDGPWPSRSAWPCPPAAPCSRSPWASRTSASCRRRAWRRRGPARWPGVLVAGEVTTPTLNNSWPTTLDRG